MPKGPYKYKPEVLDRLFRALRLGATREHACGAAGIGRQTFYDWIARDRNGDPEYAGFIVRLREAEANQAVRDLLTLEKAAADGDIKAAMFRLERSRGYTRGRTERPDWGEESREADPSRLTPEDVLQMWCERAPHRVAQLLAEAAGRKED